MINMTVRWGERYIDINFPCGDDYLTKKLLILESPGDLPTQGFVLCVNKPTELACLENKIVDLDEVNYLAKRMCSFDAKEMKQFKAALQHEGMTSVQDLINLTYNLSRYTVIQDLSSMSAIGRQHLLNLNGCMTTEQHQTIDFESVGRSLIRNNNGILTEYGLLFKNDSVPFQQEYDGQTFPYYIYEECLVTAEMQYDGKSEFLYLPCDKYAIAKAVQRLGTTEDQCQIGLYDFCVDDRDWYDRLKDILDEEGIYAVNRVCAVINDANLRLGNLEAVLQYAGSSDSESIALLTTSEAQRLLIQAKHDGYYELFLLEFATGLRIGELIGLQWDDLNPKTGVLNINKQVTLANNKMIMSKPKTKQSVRKIVLPRPVVDALMTYKERVDSQWIFPSPLSNERPWNASGLRGRLDLELERAQCPKVRFHDLRHTYATMSLEHGMDVKTLSATLGHVSAATTLDIYSHVTTSMQKQAAVSIEKAMGNTDVEIEPEPEEVPQEKPNANFQPHRLKYRKSGTGMVRQIDTNLWEGRFSPRNAQGKRISKNIYAKTEAECEAKLKVLIEEMKAEIKAEKAMLKAQESGITISM